MMYPYGEILERLAAISNAGEAVKLLNVYKGIPIIYEAIVDKVIQGEKVPFTCSYRCLRSCDPKTVPYCIAKALCNAVIGDLDNAVIFAGSNVARVKKIVSVKELMDDIVNEAIENHPEY